MGPKREKRKYLHSHIRPSCYNYRVYDSPVRKKTVFFSPVGVYYSGREGVDRCV